MKKIKVIFLFILFSFEAIGAAGWSGEAKIVDIYALNNTNVLLKLSSFNNPHNCKVNSAGDIMINTQTHPTWFTLALTAYTTGKKVNIYVSASCNAVWANTSYASVGHFRIVKQ